MTHKPFSFKKMSHITWLVILIAMGTIVLPAITELMR